MLTIFGFMVLFFSTRSRWRVSLCKRNIPRDLIVLLYIKMVSLNIVLAWSELFIQGIHAKNVSFCHLKLRARDSGKEVGYFLRF